MAKFSFTNRALDDLIEIWDYTVSQNLLGFKCGEHIIFFQEIVKNEIEIARVLHVMMDLKSKI